MMKKKISYNVCDIKNHQTKIIFFRILQQPMAWANQKLIFFSLSLSLIFNLSPALKNLKIIIKKMQIFKYCRCKSKDWRDEEILFSICLRVTEDTFSPNLSQVVLGV